MYNQKDQMRLVRGERTFVSPWPKIILVIGGQTISPNSQAGIIYANVTESCALDPDDPTKYTWPTGIGYGVIVGTARRVIIINTFGWDVWAGTVFYSYATKTIPITGGDKHITGYQIDVL